MKLKILKKFPSGTTQIQEIEIETFKWLENHEFQYVPIWNGHPIARFLSLEKDEDIVGLSV